MIAPAGRRLTDQIAYLHAANAHLSALPAEANVVAMAAG